MAPRCPNCKAEMEYDHPNYVCPECGLVCNKEMEILIEGKKIK